MEISNHQTRPLIKKVGLELIANKTIDLSAIFLSLKAALNQLMEHCNRHELITDYQSAYRPHYSCETNLIHLMKDLLWAMERPERTAHMVIDISAAFDTVGHDILLFLWSKLSLELKEEL